MYLFRSKIFGNLSNFSEIFGNSSSPSATTRFAIIHARALNGASENAGKCGRTRRGRSFFNKLSWLRRARSRADVL